MVEVPLRFKRLNAGLELIAGIPASASLGLSSLAATASLGSSRRVTFSPSLTVTRRTSAGGDEWLRGGGLGDTPLCTWINDSLLTGLPVLMGEGDRCAGFRTARGAAPPRSPPSP